jgi:rubredoxin
MGARSPRRAATDVSRHTRDPRARSGASGARVFAQIRAAADGTVLAFLERGSGATEPTMPETKQCPMCEDGVAVRSEGRLDQSGNTWLPTTVWSCERCGYTRYEAALGTRWRTDPVEPPAPARRAA